MITWEVPDLSMIQHVVKNMRPSDVEEVWLSAGMTPGDIVNHLVMQSDVVFVALADGVPVYMFGGSSGTMLDYETGTCWGLGTKWLDSHGITYAKLTKAGWKLLWDSLPVVNVFKCRILSSAHKTIRWAEWAGANLDKKNCVVGVKGGVFIPYTISRS